MRHISLFGWLGGWLISVSLCSAQMSTFPPPPPLEPPSRSSSDSTPTTPAPPAPANPDSNANQGTTSSGGGSNASSTEGANSSNASPLPIAAGLLSSMEALDDKIALHPGDLISFRVIEDKDQAVPRVVTDTGEVDFPYIGRVKVEGKTCHQVAVELKSLLEVDYYKQATVIVGLDVINDKDKDKDKDKVHEYAWIVGQVRQVGPQELSKTQPVTVSQIILRAGGFGDFADQRKVKLIHRTSLVSTPATNSPPTADIPPDVSNAQDAEYIDVKAVYEGTSTVDPVDKPNDYIVVEKKGIVF